MHIEGICPMRPPSVISDLDQEDTNAPCDISLIIPACNEENRLPQTLRMYGEAFQSRYGEQFEILVVSNGCIDGTVTAALRVSRGLPQIRVIDVCEPIGKGGAVLTGLERARGTRIIFADADAATAPTSLFALLDQLANVDICIGSRRMTGSVVSRRQPLLRRLTGRGFSAIVRVCFALPYADTQCGAKAFRRDAARVLGRVVQETRWAFDVDVLLSARANGLSVQEYPVMWEHRPGSRLRLLPTFHDVSIALWRLKRRFSRQSWGGESGSVVAAPGTSLRGGD